MSYQAVAAELTGLLPGLPLPLAQTYIQRAWRTIRDCYLWSFLRADTALVCPAQILTGTFKITQFQSTVTADAAASAALTPTILTVPPLVSRQIRFTSASGAEVYNITAVDQTVPTALVLTLDRIVQEPTNLATPYQVYRCYVTPPSDFLSWISLVDMVNGWDVGLNYTSETFDAWDPQRQSQGQAIYCGGYKAASDGSALYELWPHPTNGQTFYARYRRQGTPFAAPGDVQPAIIPDALLVQVALLNDAYRYAQMRPAVAPSLKGATWIALMQECREQIYGNPSRGIPGLLRDAKRNDSEVLLQSVLKQGHKLKSSRPAGFAGPVDAAFFQSHAITW